MLTDSELKDYCFRLHLTAAAVAYVERVRACGPSRKVRCGNNNVTAKYPSRKMDRMIPAESHTVELVFIRQLEHDEDVIEYYAQPLPIKLAYRTGSGRSVGVIHTPDFFLLRRTEVGWVECKTEDDMLSLSGIQPNRYRADGSGGWLCPPGMAAAEPLGFFYRVWTTAQIDRNVVLNVCFLEDYFNPKYPDVPNALKDGLLTAVRHAPGTTASELVEQCHGCTYDHILTLIGKGAIYVDLKEAPLNEVDRVRLYPDEQTALACRFAHLSMREPIFPPSVFEIERTPSAMPTTAPQSATLVNLLHPAEHVLNRATEKELRIANRRFELMQRCHEPAAEKIVERTMRRWKRAFKIAEQQYGCGYLGLLPMFSRRGNRHPRFPEALPQLADEVIREHYNSRKGRTCLAAYGVFRVQCRERGLVVPSYAWFTSHIRMQQTPQAKEVRDGQYLPQKTEAMGLVGNQAHGDRPWDVVHIDHTLADVELVDEDSGLNLGRAWLTVAFDACSRRVLSFYLSFERPSYRSCLTVMRECVRRNGRLPVSVVVDGGSEFKHIYFEAFCAQFQIVLKTRPSARPYFGSVIERMFGTMGTQFFQNLGGNTRISKLP